MRVIKTALISALLFFSVCMSAAGPARGEGWAGVDEKVVEKFAKDAGREPSEPLFGIEGDALLFAFLCAGAAGGFAAGYYFRKLFHEKGAAGGAKTDD